MTDVTNYRTSSNSNHAIYNMTFSFTIEVDNSLSIDASDIPTLQVNATVDV